MGQGVIVTLIGTGIIILVGLLYYFGGQKLTKVKCKTLETLGGPRYDSGVLIYQSAYQLQVPRKHDILDFIFKPLPRKGKIDLSAAGRQGFTNMQAFIDQRPITFRRDLNWSSKDFDVVGMLGNCNEVSYVDYEGQSLELKIHYHVPCQLSKLHEMGYLTVTTSSDQPEYMEVRFNNAGIIDIKELPYEVTLSLASFVDHIEVEKVGESINELLFNVSLVQRGIRSREQCASLINSPPMDNYRLEAACSFVVNLAKGVSLSVKIYYLNVKA